MPPKKGQKKGTKGKVKTPSPAASPPTEKQSTNEPTQVDSFNTDAEARKKKIAEIVERSVALFGAGSVGTMDGELVLHTPVPGVIDTGSLGLNKATGIGGYPLGRIIEIYGAESSGKTTLALHAVAQVQRKGGVAAFIDAEHALDRRYAANLGVKLDELLLSQPDFGEEALQLLDSLVEQGVALIVVDSVAALVPRAEVEGNIGDSLPGLQARMMSQAMRMLAAKVHKSNCCLLFINQTRYKIGVKFGNPRTTTGGEALKFYTSMRIEITRIGSLKKGSGDDDESGTYGSRVRIVVRKNKVAPPFHETEADIIFGEGLSWAGELLDYAAAKGLIKAAGAWYSYNDKPIGHGRQNVINYLKENPDVVQELRAGVLQP